MLFGIIALIVLGPEKLPVAARTLGKWYGKIRRMSMKLQSEIVSELELLELQEQLQAEIAKIRESEMQMKAQMDELQKNLNHTQQNLQNQKMQALQDLQNMKAQITSTEGEPTSTQAQDTAFTNPLTNRWFLLGDYDKHRRLPKAPFLPNYQADALLYQATQ